MPRRPRAVALVALAIALSVAGGARAADVPKNPLPPAELTHLQAGRLLIRAGRLEHARAFLEEARPASEEERIERLFLLGKLEMRLGLPEQAAERFEEILALRPGLTRVRLELASAYYLLGRDDKARYHFSSSLAEPLPSSVETAVEGFLRRIDARKRWSASVAASLLPETKRPDRETVQLGGVPFRLSEDARSSSGTGAFFSAGASYSPKLTETLRGVLGRIGRREALSRLAMGRRHRIRRCRALAPARRGKRLGRRTSRTTMA